MKSRKIGVGGNFGAFGSVQTEENLFRDGDNMAGLERSAKRTAKYATKTIRSARRTATEGSAAASAVARQVVGAIGNAQPKSRKGRIALAVGLTAAAIILRKKAAAARRAALA